MSSRADVRVLLEGLLAEPLVVGIGALIALAAGAAFAAWWWARRGGA